MQGESEVKWKEDENGHQGGSNKTEDSKEAVKAKEREEQGVNELGVIRNIPSCTAMKLSPEKHLQYVLKKKKERQPPFVHTSHHPTSGHKSHTHVCSDNIVQIKHSMTLDTRTILSTFCIKKGLPSKYSYTPAMKTFSVRISPWVTGTLLAFVLLGRVFKIQSL